MSKSVASGGIASKRNRVIVALRPSVITCRRAEFPHYTFSSAQFAISDPSCRNFSSSRDSNRNEPKIPPRPWLDRKLPFDVRVQKLLEAKVGTLDHHVVEFDTTGLAEHCCRLRDFVGMKFAHDVLDRVLAEKRYHDENKNPNQLPFLVPAKLFQTILYGWCNLATKGKIARVRMRETLDLMLEVVKQDDKLLDSIAAAPENGNIRQIFQEERLLPTVNTYNTVLTGLGNAARVSRDAAVEAEEVLKEMQMNHKKFGWHTKPNTKSFSLVIAAYATSGLKYSGKNAERLLRQIQKIHEEEKQLYMEEYGVPYNTRDVSANRRKIVTADAIIYTHVIKAHSHRCSPYEAGKVRDLLIEAMSMDDGTVQLDAALFTSAINAFASVAQNMKLPSDQRFLAAQHAEEILMVMLEQTRFPLESPQTGQAKKKKIDMAAPFNGE